MKIIPKIFFLLLCLLSFSKVSAQVEAIPYYSNLHFNNSFFIVAENDVKNNYYAVDLSVFKDEFEKVYFCELAFAEPKLVRLDSGNKNIAWFKTSKSDENDIAVVFSTLKEKALIKSSSISDTQKQEWLKAINK
jgi:hypothetical protein